ncbi:hypothetical protein CL619_04610 [archaeon]|nr:hypothetical protein [archaeon]|tara:strand:- start:955 stop:1440 length:486 start_codon:yes stop_codon:yes gene_type:complete
MVARKKTRKKKVSKSSSRSSVTKSSKVARSAHHKATEKMIITAVLSILVIAFVVWFSQDFRAEGQAYQVGLELQEQEAIAVAVVTSCQTSEGCQYVNSVAQSLGSAQISLNGNVVDPYQLVYYDASGLEVTGATSLNWQNDGVQTVGYLGARYPVSSIGLE